MRVEKGKTVLVRGKARISGEAEVLGIRVDEISTSRYVPVFCAEDCEVEVSGDYIVVDGCTIPESWKKLAKKDWETLFIYGGVDRGKSTLAAYLANKTDGCYVLDLDVGQSDIAHPGAMGYGFARGILSLAEVDMINGFFVGCISPTGRESRCLRGVAKLWRELDKLEGRKIVDTTGWIRGRRAREYKLAKLEIINPDVVASFEGTPSFLDDYNVFEVEVGYVVERDRAERAKTRIEMYSKWISGSEVVETSYDDVKVDTGIFDGKEIPVDFIRDVIGCEVVFVRKNSDTLVICTEKSINVDHVVVKGLKELYGVEDVYVFSKDDLNNLVVGLYRDDRYLGMGLLKSIEGDRLLIKTRIRDFDRVVFGEVRLEGEKEYIVRIP